MTDVGLRRRRELPPPAELDKAVADAVARVNAQTARYVADLRNIADRLNEQLARAPGDWPRLERP